MRPDPATVCKEYAGFVRWLAGRYYARFAKRVEYDDLAQAVRIGLWQAALSYDPDRGTFETYARLCCRRAVGLEARLAIGRGMVKPNADWATLPRFERLRDQPVRGATATEEPGQFWQAVRGVLDPKEYAIAEMLAAGRPDREAARAMGVPQQTFRGAKARVAKKLRGGLKCD